VAKHEKPRSKSAAPTAPSRLARALRFQLTAVALLLQFAVPIAWALAVLGLHALVNADAVDVVDSILRRARVRPILAGICLLGPWVPLAIAAWRRTTLRKPLLGGFVTAVLWWATYPPVGLFPLAPVALAPWCVLTARTASRLDFWVVSVALIQSVIGASSHWLTYANELGWAGMILMSSPVLLVGLPALRLLSGTGPLPWVVTLPVGFAAIEWLRSLGDIIYPWMFISHSQAPFLALIQIADIGGTYAVTVVVLSVCGLVADLWIAASGDGSLPGVAAFARAGMAVPGRVAAVGLLFVGSIFYGLHRIHEFDETAMPGPRVMVVQTNIPQSIKQSRIPSKKSLWDYYSEELTMTRAGLAADKPDLVVWPETGVPAAMNREFLDYDMNRIRGASVDVADWRRMMQGKQKEAVDTLAELRASLAVAPQCRFLAGFGGWVPTRAEGGGLRFLPRNCALMVSRHDAGDPPVYIKMRLVPWGEFIPGKDMFPSLYNFFATFMPYGEPVVTLPGKWDDYRPFELPAKAGAPEWTARFAVPICYEVTTADHVRAMVWDPHAGKRVGFLVNISNDGWFEGSAEPDMHLDIARFRCIEHRLAMARSVNTGVSGFLDPLGRITDRVTDAAGNDRLIAGTATARLTLDARVTLYSRWGDWLPAVCLVALCIAVLSVLAPRCLPLAAAAGESSQAPVESNRRKR